MNWKKTVVIVIFITLLAGGGFWGWRKIQIKRSESFTNNVSITSLQQTDTKVEQAQEMIGEQETAENIQQENQTEEDQPQQKSNDTKVADTKTVAAAAQKEETKSKEDNEDSSDDSGKTVSKLISWGYATSKSRTIDTIIIHSSYDALGSEPYDVEGLLKEYKQYGVAAHYLIDRKGVIYQLVANSNVAYHAGESKVPDGRSGVNNFSIGVELMNTENDSYTSAQYSALNSLIAKLQKSYKIKYVLGHKDIAPGRKTDPWNISWAKIKK